MPPPFIKEKLVSAKLLLESPFPLEIIYPETGSLTEATVPRLPPGRARLCKGRSNDPFLSEAGLGVCSESVRCAEPNPMAGVQVGR